MLPRNGVYYCSGPKYQPPSKGSIKYSSSLILWNRHQDIDHKEPVDRSYVLMYSISTADKDLVSSQDRFSVNNFHDPVDFSKPPKRFWRMSWVAITSKLVGKGMDCSPINRMDLWVTGKRKFIIDHVSCPPNKRDCCDSNSCTIIMTCRCITLLHAPSM